MYILDSDFSSREWDTYLEIAPRATVYHTLEWRAMLEDIFHYKTLYAVCRNSRGGILGVLPLALVRSYITGNRVVSLPFSQYAGPLVSDSDALETVLRYVARYLKHGFEYVRLRGRAPLDSRVAASSGLKLSTYCSRFFIPLANRSTPDIWKSFHRMVRRAIRKSQDSLTVDTCVTGADIESIRALMSGTCKNHGIPPYPAHLPTAIAHLLLPKNLAKIFVARFENKVVAALVLFTLNKEAVCAYNWSNKKYLGLRPNNALFWAAIKWSLENGLDVFDMGVGSPQDDQLLSFKRRWGTIEGPLYDYFAVVEGERFSPDRRASAKYEFAMLAWRFLVPKFVASAVGPRLLSHLE